jgi:hypothetical protein
VHTLKVIAAGFALLALCLLAGRALGPTSSAGLALGAKVFLPLWLVGAGVNLWIGVSRAGYTLAEETPVFFVVFAVPALVALVVWWRFSQAVT